VTDRLGRHVQVVDIAGLPEGYVPPSAALSPPGPRYDRAVLVHTLIYHQATSTSGCHCGWAVLGASHAEHVADVYEAAAR
jgi:hypothetical protein